MNIVFLSNYYNHHQKMLSQRLWELTNGNFTFIQSEPMTRERIELGWQQTIPGFVKTSYDSDSSYCECFDLINNADVLIVGNAQKKMIRKRLIDKKLTFRYSERFFKKGFDILRWVKYTVRTISDRRCNVYYLFSSAYAFQDYSICGVDKAKCYKWGYFTEVKKYEDIDALISQKKHYSILWVGRFLEWKHPEAAIYVAKRLKDDGYDFYLNMVGTGILEETIREQIRKYNLVDCVNLLGAMSPEEVRTMMEKSEIFLFTSDRNEGWGAVLNEAMNSACAIVAGNEIGSVPYLLSDEFNGCVYMENDFDSLYKKVRHLIDDKNERCTISKNAYLTIINYWNADNAANRFLQLSQAIMEGSKAPDLFEENICSKAY